MDSEDGGRAGLHEGVSTMTELSELTSRSGPIGIEGTDTETPEYAAARRRVERRRKFAADVVAYVVINACLIGVWAFTGAGYFWPGWVLAGWGVALLLDAWNVFVQRPVTEEDIQRELHRSR